MVPVFFVLARNRNLPLLRKLLVCSSVWHKTPFCVFRFLLELPLISSLALSSHVSQSSAASCPGKLLCNWLPSAFGCCLQDPVLSLPCPIHLSSGETGKAVVRAHACPGPELTSMSGCTQEQPCLGSVLGHAAGRDQCPHPRSAQEERHLYPAEPPHTGTDRRAARPSSVLRLWQLKCHAWLQRLGWRYLASGQPPTCAESSPVLQLKSHSLLAPVTCCTGALGAAKCWSKHSIPSSMQKSHFGGICP